MGHHRFLLKTPLGHTSSSGKTLLGHTSSSGKTLLGHPWIPLKDTLGHPWIPLKDTSGSRDSSEETPSGSRDSSGKTPAEGPLIRRNPPERTPVSLLVSTRDRSPAGQKVQKGRFWSFRSEKVAYLQAGKRARTQESSSLLEIGALSSLSDRFIQESVTFTASYARFREETPIKRLGSGKKAGKWRKSRQK